MITVIFLAIFGTVLVGFLLYHFVFSDEGRKGKAGTTQTTPASSEPKTGRASGLD